MGESIPVASATFVPASPHLRKIKLVFAFVCTIPKFKCTLFYPTLSGCVKPFCIDNEIAKWHNQNVKKRAGDE